MTEVTEQISVVQKEGYLSIALPPYQTPQKMEAQIAAVYDAVQQHGERLVLIDCRATRQRIPILDLYDLCIYMVSLFGPIQPKVAALASPEAAYPDRFGENVVRNRGLDLIRFLNDEQAAVNWLLGRGPAPPR